MCQFSPSVAVLEGPERAARLAGLLAGLARLPAGARGRRGGRRTVGRRRRSAALRVTLLHHPQSAAARLRRPGPSARRGGRVRLVSVSHGGAGGSSSPAAARLGSLGALLCGRLGVSWPPASGPAGRLPHGSLLRNLHRPGGPPSGRPPAPPAASPRSPAGVGLRGLRVGALLVPRRCFPPGRPLRPPSLLRGFARRLGMLLSGLRGGLHRRMSSVCRRGGFASPRPASPLLRSLLLRRLPRLEFWCVRLVL